MKTLKISIDDAYDIAGGYPDDGVQSKVIDVRREKYHMRQLVLVNEKGEWFGFEFFDALDKHGESEIGENYVNHDESQVTLYKVQEKQIITYEYEFQDREEEEY